MLNSVDISRTHTKMPRSNAVFGASSYVVVASFLACISSAHALVDLPHRARGGVAWHMRQENQPYQPPQQKKQKTLFIELPIDHQDPSAGTFRNKYFLDTSNWDGEGPCFFTMGQEAPSGGVGGGYLGQLAREKRAAMVGIEHRFYGDSVPNGDWSVANLKYLTVAQHLADSGALIAHVNATQLPGGKGCRHWVAIGGSYSGALSAWFRSKYPHVISAALSSSGVVNAILDFTGFDEQVASAIGAECSSNLRATTAAFAAAEAQGGAEAANARRLFGVRPDLPGGDFAYMLADAAAMADQYGHKADLCSTIGRREGAKNYSASTATHINTTTTTSSSPTTAAAAAAATTTTTITSGGGNDAIDRMTTFADFVKKFWGKDFASGCFYDSECVRTQKTRWQPTSRSWWWQKCHELAYFQNAPATGSLRLPLVNASYHRQRCAYMFANGVYPDTAATNAKYGGVDTPGDKVFFSDFSDDPWQKASVMTSRPPGMPFNLVHCDGCGHCKDLGAPQKTDPAPLIAERANFEKYLNQWLA